MLPSQNDIIDELLDRDKIKPDTRIEVITVIDDVYDYNIYSDERSKIKYLIILFSSSLSERVLDDLLLQFEMTHKIIIVCHQRHYYFWGKSTMLEDLFRTLRERYIRVVDTDRLFSRENWLSTDDIFSIILTK